QARKTTIGKARGARRARRESGPNPEADYTPASKTTIGKNRGARRAREKSPTKNDHPRITRIHGLDTQAGFSSTERAEGRPRPAPAAKRPGRVRSGRREHKPMTI